MRRVGVDDKVWFGLPHRQLLRLDDRAFILKVKGAPVYTPFDVSRTRSIHFFTYVNERNVPVGYHLRLLKAPRNTVLGLFYVYLCYSDRTQGSHVVYQDKNARLLRMGYNYQFICRWRTSEELYDGNNNT